MRKSRIFPLTAAFLLLSGCTPEETAPAMENSAEVPISLQTDTTGTPAQTTLPETEPHFSIGSLFQHQTTEPEPEPEPEPAAPTVQLDTDNYPFCTEAGLTAELLYNPLRAVGGIYTMLENSESVILSEPVEVTELPEPTDLYFTYVPALLDERLSQVCIMRFDPESDDPINFAPLLDPEIDQAQCRISIPITETGIYYVMDVDAWARLWGVQTDSPLPYRNNVIGFAFDIPAEIMLYEYSISFAQLDDQYLPDDVVRTDENGTRYVDLFMFDRENSDPGLQDFSMLWMTNSSSPDAAADELLEQIDLLNQNYYAGCAAVLEDVSQTLQDGTYCRILVTDYLGRPEDGLGGGIEYTAYYALNESGTDMLAVEYMIYRDASDTLRESLRSSLDSFRAI